MACVFPGAPDLDSFWRNVEHGVDAITDVPGARWDPLYYDPSSSAPDRFYCRRGGFIDAFATFDPVAYGLMPNAAAGAEPDQLLTLDVAARALADAGYAERPFPRERTSVILGRGNYIGPATARLEQRLRTAEQLIGALRGLLPELGEAKLAEIKASFQAALGPYGPDTAIGLVPNLTASRIANRLDLGGSAYTIDAACASALVALDRACAELASGAADLVFTGGVHASNDLASWSIFCQLGALSRRQEIRPFDRGADGLLIGEGVGLVVVKRLEDARRDGDRIYAVVRGTGVASDGRHTSLMTPSAEGQLLALERAWRRAGADPGTLGLLEAHGTGTPVGDATELETTARFFGPHENGGARAVVGSVKSMIGHTMPAAGAAGLIKTALSLHHRVLPPTLHCDEPHGLLAETRFRPVAEAEPWETGGSRRAAVSAFGFGGINAHVVLDALESTGSRRRLGPRPQTSGRAEPEVLVLAADSQAGLLQALEEGESSLAGPWRLAVVDPTPQRLETARGAVERGQPRRGRDGIFFSPAGLVAEGGRVAFLFPGVEAGFDPQIADVAEHFGWPATELPAEGLEEHAIGVLLVGRVLHRALRELGVEPDAIAGHSIGEWSGLNAAGIVADGDAEELLARIQGDTIDVPGVAYAAVGCSAERARALTGSFVDIFVTHDNCPHQSMLCGPEESLEAALGRLRQAAVLGQILERPRSGFHSPMFAGYLDPFRSGYRDLPLQSPRTPLWSATTCSPYPHEADAIRELSLRHLVEPVRFRELVVALHDEGVRVFVQVGTGSLVGFVEDTLAGKPHLAVAANVPNRSGLEQLRWLAASLFVEGVPVRLDRVGLGPSRPAGGRLQLALSVPLVALDVGPLPTTRATTSLPRAGDDPVLAELAAVLSAVAEAGAAVEQAVAARPEAPADEVRRRVRFSVDEWPELGDHCFYQQPRGWPHLEDRRPVVPLTMSLELMLDVARELVPGRVAVALERIRAARWIEVAPPTDADVHAVVVSPGRIHVAIEGYVEADVVFAGEYPEPPPLDATPLAGQGPAPLSADDVYRRRWMFHGPSYQAIRQLDAIGDDGIRGTLQALPAKGALLDGAGQLLAAWLRAFAETDWLAMPIAVERIELFGSEPAAGARVDCAVRIRSVEPGRIRGDLELAHEGRLYARILGWEDKRFDVGPEVTRVATAPDREVISEVYPDGYTVLRLDDLAIPTVDDVLRRYLSSPERAELEQLPPPRRRSRLAGRIAAKDAIRRLLFERGCEALFPVEVELTSAPNGRPLVRGDLGVDVRVSIAHTRGTAVALAAVGYDPGIDVEEIAPRGEGFERLALAEAESALLPEESRAEWLTRFWCAKEAVGKANGTGLDGQPRSLNVEATEGERVNVAGTWVETRRLEPDLVVAWTAR
jgi:acyl transferase domain-containing protein/phosphopantetheinyl transferase